MTASPPLRRTTRGACNQVPIDVAPAGCATSGASAVTRNGSLHPVEHSPVVEMLWEAEDPRQELTKRFGFPSGSAAADWAAEVLDRHWGLTIGRCDRLVISDRNAMAWVQAGDRSLVAKWSSAPSRFTHLEDAARLVAWLECRGIPVAAPIAATDGRLLVEVSNGANGKLRSRLPLPGGRFLLGVLRAIEGALLDASDAEHVDEAGRMLATLHEALADYPGRIGRRRGAANQQIIHNDFRSANIVHDGTRIAAVLDFEEVTFDTRVADLAKSAVLLATRYHDWAPTTPEVRDAYVQAYDRHAHEPLTRPERDELRTRIASFRKSFGWE